MHMWHAAKLIHSHFHSHSQYMYIDVFFTTRRWFLLLHFNFPKFHMRAYLQVTKTARGLQASTLMTGPIWSARLAIAEQSQSCSSAKTTKAAKDSRLHYKSTQFLTFAHNNFRCFYLHGIWNFRQRFIEMHSRGLFNTNVLSQATRHRDWTNIDYDPWRHMALPLDHGLVYAAIYEHIYIYIYIYRLYMCVC